MPPKLQFFKAIILQIVSESWPKLLPKAVPRSSCLCRAKLLLKVAPASQSCSTKLLHKAVPQSRFQNYRCSPKLLKFRPKITTESSPQSCFLSYSPKLSFVLQSTCLFVNAAAKPQNCSPQLFTKIVLPQSCYRKWRPKAVPQNNAYRLKHNVCGRRRAQQADNFAEARIKKKEHRKNSGAARQTRAITRRGPGTDLEGIEASAVPSRPC